MYSDPLEDFRNNFYKMLENERIEKERILKRKQKNCLHSYSKMLQYNSVLNLVVCEKCAHAKFVKI